MPDFYFLGFDLLGFRQFYSQDAVFQSGEGFIGLNINRQNYRPRKGAPIAFLIEIIVFFQIVVGFPAAANGNHVVGNGDIQMFRFDSGNG
ncbi:MAG: hypothetical protein UV45_C0023G0010 [Candidatus Azambacteria bacterium GW2011_GWB1_42_72]|nr:MAG: hypothetical protein UV45_C0023G0010 [Candidatus Azambacteria bacterium GW2011_GWB1_42_72]